MIRLNDINKTVIDENLITGYKETRGVEYANKLDKYYLDAIGLMKSLNELVVINYRTKEDRDKDIELLDMLFDVKSIEEKAMCVAKPELYPDEGGINEESEPVREEYITWNSVTEGDVNSVIFGVDVRLRYNSFLNAIVIYKEIDKIVATIYDESLFKSLELKKVE